MKRQLDANVHVRDPASGLIFCIRMPRQHKSIGSIAQKVYKRACPNGTGGRGNNSPIAAQQLSTTYQPSPVQYHGFHKKQKILHLHDEVSGKETRQGSHTRFI